MHLNRAEKRRIQKANPPYDHSPCVSDAVVGRIRLLNPPLFGPVGVVSTGYQFSRLTGCALGPMYGFAGHRCVRGSEEADCERLLLLKRPLSNVMPASDPGRILHQL